MFNCTENNKTDNLQIFLEAQNLIANYKVVKNILHAISPASYQQESKAQQGIKSSQSRHYQKPKHTSNLVCFGLDW